MPWRGPSYKPTVKNDRRERIGDPCELANYFSRFLGRYFSLCRYALAPPEWKCPSVSAPIRTSSKPPTMQFTGPKNAQNNFPNHKSVFHFADYLAQCFCALFTRAT